MMEYNTIHKEEEKRFCIEADGFVGYVEYQIVDGSLDILHTVVPPEIGGRGIASALVGAAYKYADEHGLKRKATCSYAIKWLAR